MSKLARRLVGELIEKQAKQRAFDEGYARGRADERAEAGWRPISEAKKDMTTIWAALRADLVAHTGRADLERWAGVQVPMRHPGLTERGTDLGWNIAAPVGHGGFPDDWIAGWREMPAPPEALADPADAGGGA